MVAVDAICDGRNGKGCANENDGERLTVNMALASQDMQSQVNDNNNYNKLGLGACNRW